jgi:opacity protein-like surface antigen
MKKYLLAAAAASRDRNSGPVAQNSGPYVGIEGGVMFPRDTQVDADVNFVDPLEPDVVFRDVFDLDYKTGFDIDAIAGYDFGMFRLEGELGYKRAKIDEIELDQSFINAYEDATGVDLSNVDFDIGGSAKVTSAMVNGLVDIDAGGMALYAGGGIGRAWVRMLGDKDSAWAYQFIAGARAPITDSIDVGVKYRYFRTAGLNFRQQSAVHRRRHPAYQRQQVQLAQPSGEPDLQLRCARSCAGLCPGRSAAASAAAGSPGDPDLPRRNGDPGDRDVPGSAASASSAAADARARLKRSFERDDDWPGWSDAPSGPFV